MSRWGQLLFWVREFLGEHDYARYAADWQARHADDADGARPLTEREFFDERCRLRYGPGTQRCC
jgi:uncharacterized short protein YbdD (DUF466 family)